MAYLKAELSGRSPYWIPKHRYYELKHYCLQYPDWVKAYKELAPKVVSSGETHGSDPGDPTGVLGSRRGDISHAIAMVQRCVENATDEPVLRSHLFKGVTEGVPFVQLQTLNDIPCGKDMYYECYRRFFWLLSNEKGI